MGDGISWFLSKDEMVRNYRKAMAKDTSSRRSSEVQWVWTANSSSVKGRVSSDCTWRRRLNGVGLVRVRCRVFALLSSYSSVGQWREGISIRCIVGQWRVHQGTVCLFCRPIWREGTWSKEPLSIWGLRSKQEHFFRSKFANTSSHLCSKILTSSFLGDILWITRVPPTKRNGVLCTLVPWTGFRVTFQSPLT